jgi:hypothetical protein
MLVIFQRTGQRRYAVHVKRASFPDLEMNPAPGYDPRMPHDMMHLVVEAKLGLTRGVFGQLAAGGDAGTFHLSPQLQGTSRDLARLRRDLKARGKKLLREGRDESAQSERATCICWQAWLARSESTRESSGNHTVTQHVTRGNEMRRLNEITLAEICDHLNELSSHWSSLDIGGSMVVHWPDLAVE